MELAGWIYACYPAPFSRDLFPSRKIVRRTGLSHKTIRKYLHSSEVEPGFKVPERSTKSTQMPKGSDPSLT